MNRELIPYFIVAVPLLPLVARKKRLSTQFYLVGLAARLTARSMLDNTRVDFCGACCARCTFCRTQRAPSADGRRNGDDCISSSLADDDLPADVQLGNAFDALTSIMVPVVLFVGLMVQIFSVGYLYDRKYDIARYFALLSFFMFSMLLLVVAANLFVFFVGWEAVGLSSYKLISFLLTKTPRSAPARRRSS